MKFLSADENIKIATKKYKSLFLIVLLFFSGTASVYFYFQTNDVDAYTETTPPSTPANLVVNSVLGGKVSLSWDVSVDDTEVTGYEVSKNGRAILIVTKNGIILSEGITPGSSYEFKVRATDAAGNWSGFSNVVFATVPLDTQGVSAPTNLLAEPISTTQINLNWTAPTTGRVARYEVMRGDELIGVTGDTIFSAGGLLPKTLYTFSIKAFGSSGGDALSSTVSATTLSTDLPPLTAPVNLTAKVVSVTRVDLLWTSPTSTRYVLEYKIYKDGVFLASSKTNSFSVTELSPKTTYSFTVSVYGTDEQESPQSAPVVAKTLVDTVPPTTPTELTGIAVSFSRINLSWRASTDNSDIAGYNIYKDGDLMTTVSGTETEASATGLVELQTYNFTVQAFDRSKNFSPESLRISVKTSPEPDTVAPTVPGNFVAKTISPSRIVLSWKASTDKTGVNGYNVFRGNAFVASVRGTSFTDTGRAPQQTYAYQVSAYDYAGNISARTESVSAMTSPLPTGLPVSFSLIFGEATCKKDGNTYMPVTFFTEPLVGGYYEVSGETMEKQTFDSKTVDFKNGRYEWKGFAKERYLEKGVASGSFMVPFLNCAEIEKSKNVVKISPTTSPDIFGGKVTVAPSTVTGTTLEVFATYAETESAMKKESASVILEDSPVSQKLQQVQDIRNTYALTSEAPAVMIGGMSFSRVSDASGIIRKIENILELRTASSTLIDSDGDGITDYDEKNIYGTNPKEEDTDGDGITDSEELLAGTNPTDPNITPVAYENPKMNTVFSSASTSPEIFSIDSIEAILAPSITGDAEKMVGVTFTGKAPANGFITLYIFSSPTAVTIQADETGQWTYVLDKTIENGLHSFYITMTDDGGKILVKSDPVSFVKSESAVFLGKAFPVVSTAPAEIGFLEKNIVFIGAGAGAFVFILGIVIFFMFRRKNEAEVIDETTTQR